jgi:hypothetical protein
MRPPVDRRGLDLSVTAGKIGAKWIPVDFDGQIRE